MRIHLLRSRFGLLVTAATAVCCLICLMYLASGSVLSRLCQTTSNVWYKYNYKDAMSPEPSLRLIYHGLSEAALWAEMEDADADANYYSYLYHLDFTCEDYIRLGSVQDGGWDVCVVPPYQLNRPCLVYSFGINYDFTFDDAVSKRFGCTVRAFDPSMGDTKSHRRDENIWFYNIALGPRNARATNISWETRTLRSIMSRLNDTRKVIDYLKIDIENNEWDVLRRMYKSDTLTRVKQLALEIHIMPTGTSVAKVFYQRWTILRKLEEFGFRRWYWHFNHFGAYIYFEKPRSCCYELVYINTNFLPGGPMRDVR